jgi:signal transduction histidine kinase
VGDRNRITQVVPNFLENALAFTSEGVVSIGVSRKKKQEDHQEEAIVIVEDTGSGISPEIFSRLFTKFSSKSFSGTGLGLYISKNIIEAHGGEIWAQNNNVKGKSGATFSLSKSIFICKQRKGTRQRRKTNPFPFSFSFIWDKG